jgi:hypothetical protein
LEKVGKKLGISSNPIAIKPLAEASKKGLILCSRLNRQNLKKRIDVFHAISETYSTQ